MKGFLGVIGGICIASAASLYHFNHNSLGLLCAFSGIVFLVLSAIFYVKDIFFTRHENTNISRARSMVHGVATDPATDLVIKSISGEKDGFKTTQDIVRETSLPLKMINKAVDWLYMNNFVSEEKGRNGKTYVLTPEGRAMFKQIIEREIC